MKDTDSKTFADGDKVELTVGDVKRAAEKCGTAKEVLKEMFPDVFNESAPPPPEWEDVTGKCEVRAVEPRNGEVSICVPMGKTISSHEPKAHVDIFPNFKWSIYEGHYQNKIKIGDGKIWRRKSE